MACSRNGSKPRKASRRIECCLLLFGNNDRDLFWQLRRTRLTSEFALHCIFRVCRVDYRSKLNTAEAIRRWIPSIKFEMNYAIQLESAGSPTNYTYLDRTELNSDSKYTDTYDATTFHKIVLKAQQPTGLPDSINNAQITNSRLNSELMCVGVNFSKLGFGPSYLSSIVIGINPDSGFGDM